jgi:hypothetical protein
MTVNLPIASCYEVLYVVVVASADGIVLDL